MSRSVILRENLVIASDTKNLGVVRNFVAKVLGSGHVPVSDRNKIILAVDEAVTNIIEHGYGPGQRGTIEVSLAVQTDRVEITLRDSAPCFDPTEVELPEIEKHVVGGKKKGLGIFLIRQIMDEVRYTLNGNGENELIMIREFSPGKKTAV